VTRRRTHHVEKPQLFLPREAGAVRAQRRSASTANTFDLELTARAVRAYTLRTSSEWSLCDDHHVTKCRILLIGPWSSLWIVMAQASR
jgi:hypothetical protein